MPNKGFILVFSTAIISGFSVFINKFGVAINNSDIFAFAKIALVALFIGAIILFFNKKQEFLELSKKQWLHLFLLGLIGGSIPFLLFFRGLSLTGAAQGAFIHKTLFIFVAAGAVIFLKEKVNKGFFIGGLSLLAGLMLTLKSFNLSFGWGDLLILAAVLFWSAENILAKHILKNLSGNMVAFGRMFFGAILIFVYLVLSGQSAQLLSLSWPQFGWIAITAALLLGYTLTWYNGLKLMPVSVATTILLAGLPITTLLSAINVGQVSAKNIYSGALILSGLILIMGFDRIWERIKMVKKYVRS
ncbi:MAG TPA: DMT family transporter [Candidatus Portnoybacteria bacterium]|nr:DMT family transporter [Candidatus Portnoybacteria bacterium]